MSFPLDRSMRWSRSSKPNHSILDISQPVSLFSIQTFFSHVALQIAGGCQNVFSNFFSYFVKADHEQPSKHGCLCLAYLPAS